jgi:predicted metalloprotease
MRWTPGGESSDIEDRRDDSGGGGGGFQFGGFHLGIGGTILLLILSLIFHKNLFVLFSGGGDVPVSTQQYSGRPDAARTASEKPAVQFVSFVLDDVQQFWDKALPQQANIPYRHAKLVLYRDVTDAGCGTAQSATGPFYCPADEKVYVDLSFFDELAQRFGAPGQFAQAYVLAHEIGHHVQKLLGIEGKVRRLQQRNPGEQNPLSVRLELQADCFAGVWAYSGTQRNMIDQNDISEGLRAAAAVGDDRLQRAAGRRVSPDSFTHGSSEQRTQWFKQGISGGQISACDTFKQ